ncbi:MAG: cobalt-factor II C(20)-methyltransferase [Methanoregulaceae archaeon]|nr:cobalt-factor II C(20)-methyltransferase [Methanoregulaceae archaeon]
MLVGLGLGPGDPELLTLRAVRLLRKADAVFVPGRMAGELVAPYRDAEVLEFPMTQDETVIQECMERNADRIAPVATSGLAVLGILGDPNFFSTFSRLCGVISERYPGIDCTTEPGVSAITAFASAVGIPLSDGFEVTDGGPPGSRILLKVRKPRDCMKALINEGFSRFILVERMYLPEMKVYRDGEMPVECDYMSVMYAER